MKLKIIMIQIDDEIIPDTTMLQLLNTRNRRMHMSKQTELPPLARTQAINHSARLPNSMLFLQLK